MKCDQCEMLQISTAGVSLPCHEIGCPNTHKVWNEEEQEWQNQPEEEDDIEDFWEEPEVEDEEEEFFDRENWEPDLGGTGHGDISWSDADPGL